MCSTFQGYDVSANSFIGPTPNIQLVLPFEASPRVFFHRGSPGDSVWSLERYLALLPPAWRLYAPILEAYWAGQAGRTGIIAHGTTIDPDFYREKPFFPNTPSSWFWSSSPYAGNSSDAWYVLFSYGHVNYGPKYFQSYVRLVRGGQ